MAGAANGWRGLLGGRRVLLVIVGVAAAIGGAHPVLELGGWLGFGHSALRADGLAGIFFALTGITAARRGAGLSRAARRAAG